MNRKKSVIAILIILILFLSGCTKSTSVILQVKNRELTIVGFTRGQSFWSMMCMVCPHVGARVTAKTLSGDLICKGGNEIIVPLGMTENQVLAVKCKGLENYNNQKIMINVSGFVGGKSEPINDTKFEKEVTVEFEKI